jgi:hypothetical protein
MAGKLLGKCPVCGGEMAITRLKCRKCETEISGDFTPCIFCRLDKDQEGLVTVFLKNRGNIREVERELGISYPTVRSRLDDALQALGLLPRTRSKGGKEPGSKEEGGEASGKDRGTA